MGASGRCGCVGEEAEAAGWGLVSAFLRAPRQRASTVTLPRVGVARTLVTSTLVGAAGSARAGIGAAGLTVRRTPSLVALGARATLARGSQGARADAVFRDELLMLLDDVAELAWRQARRARLEIGERTSPNGTPQRRHRVKT